MLTQDENIVDIRFTVQYRLKDARAFLFENRDPDEAVMQAAESAVREIVGKSKIDSVLYEQRDAIAADLVKSIQAQLDRLKTGILIVNVNVQSVQPPEQVQAAFDDALKAGQDRDAPKNEGQAYANDVIPKAQGTAARLREEAEGYKCAGRRAGRGRRAALQPACWPNTRRRPQVTRDRLYIDTMQQIYANVTKVHGRRAQRLEPAVPAARQAAAAGRQRRAAAARRRAVDAAPPTPSTAARVDVALARRTQRSRDRDSR